MRGNRPLLGPALALPLLLLFAGCTGTPAPVKADVVIAHNHFLPENITVQAGASLVWRNDDNVTHTVTGDDAQGGVSSELLPNLGVYRVTFTRAGTFGYHCTPHPWMQGNVTVTPS